MFYLSNVQRRTSSLHLYTGAFLHEAGGVVSSPIRVAYRFFQNKKYVPTVVTAPITNSTVVVLSPSLGTFFANPYQKATYTKYNTKAAVDRFQISSPYKKFWTVITSLIPT
jgi:hypothetical protein